MTKTPPNQAIRLAISQTMTNTQKSLAQDLGLQSEYDTRPNFKISKLRVKSREKLDQDSFQTRLGGASVGDVYKVKGTYSAKIVSPNYQQDRNGLQNSSPFEIYLSTNPNETGEEVSTWFLIRPDSDRS